MAEYSGSHSCTYAVYIDDSEQYSKGMAQVVGKGAGLAKKRAVKLSFN